MTDMIFNFLEFLHKLDKIDRIRQNWTFKCLFRLACVSRDIYISSKIFGFLSITFWWTRLNFQFLGLICLHNILPEHEAASDRSQGSPCWGCCVSVWSPAGRAGRSRKEERIRGRWPAVPSLAWDSLGVGCHWPAQSRCEAEVGQDISSLDTNLLAQLNVDLISKTDVSVSGLHDLLGHTVDRHPHLGLPVGHVDLDQFEGGHGLFLLLFLIDKSERFAGNKKILGLMIVFSTRWKKMKLLIQCLLDRYKLIPQCKR